MVRIILFLDDLIVWVVLICILLICGFCRRLMMFSLVLMRIRMLSMVVSVSLNWCGCVGLCFGLFFVGLLCVGGVYGLKVIVLVMGVVLMDMGLVGSGMDGSVVVLMLLWVVVLKVVILWVVVFCLVIF